MTLTLHPPSVDDTRSALADWLELETLFSSRQQASKASLTGVLDFVEEEIAGEHESDDDSRGDRILEDAKREAIVSSAFEELSYRQKTLGGSYPFSLDPTRLVLHRSVPAPGNTTGQTIYLFCLLVSAIRGGGLQPAPKGLEKRIGNVFQVCACLAAGGYVNGEVVSFGFPRATGTDFMPALKSAYERFGMCALRSEIPDGFPDSLKDGGIDIIAWRDHPDRMPGKLYLLGQCASGKNWSGKSVVEYIEQLHGAWFTQRPASHCFPAIFIPFTMHGDLGEKRRGPYMEALRNSFWFHELRFGIVFDRLRIVHFSNLLLQQDEAIRETVDGNTLLPQVKEWVDELLEVEDSTQAAA